MTVHTQHYSKKLNHDNSYIQSEQPSILTNTLFPSVKHNFFPTFLTANKYLMPTEQLMDLLSLVNYDNFAPFFCNVNCSKIDLSLHFLKCL